MNETPTPEQRDQRRSIKIILALTVLVAAGVAFLPSAPSETPTAAQIQHRLAMVAVTLVLCAIALEYLAWRFDAILSR